MPKGSKTKKKPTVPRKSRGGADKQTLYRKEYDAIAERLVQHTAATVHEIADILGVNTATLYKWQSRHATFRQALTLPLEMANKRVELSTYQEAVGYWVEETETRTFEGKVATTKRRVWMRPNPTTLIWWTKCKAGWRPPEEPQVLLPTDDGAITIDNQNRETDKQIARRLAFIIHKGDLDNEDAA